MSAENLSPFRGLANGDDYEAKLPFTMRKLGSALNFPPLTLNYLKIHASFVTAEYEQWRGGMLCWRNLISASVAQFSAVRGKFVYELRGKC